MGELKIPTDSSTQSIRKTKKIKKINTRCFLFDLEEFTAQRMPKPTAVRSVPIKIKSNKLHCTDSENCIAINGIDNKISGENGNKSEFLIINKTNYFKLKKENLILLNSEHYFFQQLEVF